MTGRRSKGRYRVRRGALDDDTVELDAGEARHMAVRRLAPGDLVALFDGSGLEACGEIVGLDATGATVRIRERRATTAESPLALWLAQGLPVKLPRVDDVVRQATELGVAGILPVIAARSELPGGGAAALARRVSRWRRLAAAAAKQCGRGCVPEILDPVGWAEIPWERLPEPRLLLDPLGESLAIPVSDRPPAASVLVGPEGGWSDREAQEAVEHRARRVRLGPRILRADSAAPAAIAVIQHRWGDL